MEGRRELAEKTVSGWEEFVSFAKDMSFGYPLKPMFAFRGHTDATWTLRPRLIRLAGDLGLDNPAKVIRLEQAALDEFKAQAYLHLPGLDLSAGSQNILTWWGLMQQHGAPTRLLDWTDSPFVAAYFAVERDFKLPGAVWAVQADNVGAQMTVRFQDLGSWLADDNIQNTRLLWALNAPHDLRFFRLLRENPRTLAQQARFSVCAFVLGSPDEILPQVPGETVAKIVIPASLKLEFLRQLKLMNITGSTLFPGADGLGRSVTEFMTLTRNFLFL
jgi:hypothetical protein